MGWGPVAEGSPRAARQAREQHKPGHSLSPGNWESPAEARLGHGTAGGPGLSGPMAGMGRAVRSLAAASLGQEPTAPGEPCQGE